MALKSILITLLFLLQAGPIALGRTTNLVATPKSIDPKQNIPEELKGIGIEEHLGTQIDLGLTFKDEKGAIVPVRSFIQGRKPTLLLPVYYSCPNLCNFFLNGALDGLKKMKWSVGQEFQILTFSIDPREDSDLAAKKKKNHIAAYGRVGDAEAQSRGWRFWVDPVTSKNGDASGSGKALAEQVGFKYRFNKEENQFAHTSAMIVLTPDGRISRYLYGIEFQPQAVQLALSEASGNKIGSLMDRLLLFCFHYDPKAKKYSLFVTRLLRISSLVLLLAMSSYLFTVWLSERRRQKPFLL